MTLRFSKTFSKEGVVARLFGPIGVYPPTAEGTADHGYLLGKKAAFSLVRIRKHPGQYEAYSEMEWAFPEEIALYASLSMAYDDDGHRITLYPLPDVRRLDVEAGQPLNDFALLQEVKERLIRTWRSEKRRRAARWPELEREPWQPYALPPFADSTQRYVTSEAVVTSRQKMLLLAIDPSDLLMIRALSTWLRSAMLSMHMLFMEEAITTLFISMEASFRLIRRRLVLEGVADPSARDAAVFLGLVFDEEPLERYFAQYYDNRVATLHPESRFGIFPHAPLMADDYYHLRDSLRHLYIYLLTGEVVPAG